MKSDNTQPENLEELKTLKELENLQLPGAFGTTQQSAEKTLGDFKSFLLRGNVVDLAVGVVIGAAFSTVVTGFVNDLINPLIGIFGNVNSFSGIQYSIHGSRPFLIGSFINTVIAFFITAAVVFFFVVRPVNVLTRLHKPAEGPETRQCPYCLSMIPSKAVACAYCTRDVTVAIPTPVAVKA